MLRNDHSFFIDGHAKPEKRALRESQHTSMVPKPVQAGDRIEKDLNNDLWEKTIGFVLFQSSPDEGPKASASGLDTSKC